MQPMVLVYFTYMTGWFWTRANVGIHIPAPWVAYGIWFSLKVEYPKIDAMVLFIVFPPKKNHIDPKKQDAAARAACHGTGKAML